MRLGYEQLLIKHRVDLVFNGHVHSYERSKPVVNNKLSECGPVHLIVGDGGNIEGIYKDFINDKPQPGFCANPKSGKQVSMRLHCVPTQLQQLPQETSRCSALLSASVVSPVPAAGVLVARRPQKPHRLLSFQPARVVGLQVRPRAL